MLATTAHLIQTSIIFFRVNVQMFNLDKQKTYANSQNNRGNVEMTKYKVKIIGHEFDLTITDIGIKCDMFSIVRIDEKYFISSFNFNIIDDSNEFYAIAEEILEIINSSLKLSISGFNLLMLEHLYIKNNGEEISKIVNMSANYYRSLKYCEYLTNLTYRASLIKRLNNMQAINALPFDKDAYENAKCLGKEQEKNSLIGQKRTKCKDGSYTECCSYDMDNGKNVVMQWLVDEKLQSVGLRLNCLNKKYTKNRRKSNPAQKMGC